jgi:hypothetical protein
MDASVQMRKEKTNRETGPEGAGTIKGIRTGWIVTLPGVIVRFVLLYLFSVCSNDKKRYGGGMNENEILLHEPVV